MQGEAVTAPRPLQAPHTALPGKGHPLRSQGCFWLEEGEENDWVRLQGKKRSMVILSVFHFFTLVIYIYIYKTCFLVISPCSDSDEKSSNHISQREVLGSKGLFCVMGIFLIFNSVFISNTCFRILY